jgi:Mn-dependent DtxR family transcriptional regulator
MVDLERYMRIIDRVVLGVIEQHVGPDGRATIQRKQIAALIEVDESTVYRSTQHLARRGLLVLHGGKGKQIYEPMSRAKADVVAGVASNAHG